MSNAKICDMCGAVIEARVDIVPKPRYTITMQRLRLFSLETITVDLCAACFESIREINRKKWEKEIHGKNDAEL